MPDPKTPQPSNPDPRIAALEESVGFAEHKAAQLDALVADLSAQVYELGSKLERLENRLTDLKADIQTGEPGAVPNDPPPHSHRPL